MSIIYAGRGSHLRLAAWLDFYSRTRGRTKPRGGHSLLDLPPVSTVRRGARYAVRAPKNSFRASLRAKLVEISPDLTKGPTRTRRLDSVESTRGGVPHLLFEGVWRGSCALMDPCIVFMKVIAHFWDFRCQVDFQF